MINSIKSEVNYSMYPIYKPCIPLDCDNLKEFVTKCASKWVKGEILAFVLYQALVSLIKSFGNFPVNCLKLLMNAEYERNPHSAPNTSMVLSYF